jgi:hypothetical protein
VPLRRLSGPIDRRENPPTAIVILVLGVLVASRIPALARSPGEIDEAIFAGAVTRFDLFQLSPQGPGFPVWILIGRALLPVFVTPFNSLATASTILAGVMLPALYLWGRRMVGGWAALGATVFAAALPVVWVNGGRAFSDTPGTAFCLLAAGLLSLILERRGTEPTRWREYVAARRARILAALAGLAAAAGFGVRPHLVLGFGLLFLLCSVRLLSRRDRRDAGLTFLGSAIAGSLAWVAWLLAEAGGPEGFWLSVTERAGFRAHALATARVGGLLDSFLVRDFISAPRAVVFWLVAAAGVVALVKRRSRAAMDLPVVLLPLFGSLWWLHNRAMSRYSVPFALVASLLFGAGLEAIFRRRALAFLAAVSAAGLFVVEYGPEVLRSARETTPPMAAIEYLERYTHPGRETIVADEPFHAFLRTELWEGRLAIWGYSTTDFLTGFVQTNERLVRLADFTGDPHPPSAIDPGWKTWSKAGRVADALGNRRLLVVGVRDPAPPLFGPGFGVTEEEPGRPAFHWAGPGARLVVPGIEGPPVALIAGDRDGDAGETTLRVTEAVTGETVLTRTIAPGPFELAIVPRTFVGPLPQPNVYILSCDRPVPLPKLDGAERPALGCFRILDATYSVPPEELWARRGERYELDVGAPTDRRAGLAGFYARERNEKTGLEMRWTSGAATAIFSPVSGFVPRRLILRVRPPGGEAVPLRISIAGVACGEILLSPGEFEERRVDLPEAARAAFRGADPILLTLTSPTWVPRRAGKGDDDRPLGVGLTRLSLE